MPCKYNGNVCGLLGNADQDPTNDNVMPNGEIASSDAELGDSWLVNSFPDFLNLNTAQCEPGVSVTDVEPECPAMDLRSAANVCKMIIDPRLVKFLIHSQVKFLTEAKCDKKTRAQTGLRSDRLLGTFGFEKCIHKTCTGVLNLSAK